MLKKCLCPLGLPDLPPDHPTYTIDGPMSLLYLAHGWAGCRYLGLSPRYDLFKGVIAGFQSYLQIPPGIPGYDLFNSQSIPDT